MTNRKFTEDELVELVKAYVERKCGKCNVKDLGVCCNSCFLLPISLSADLINRQKAEIERLEDKVKRLKESVRLMLNYDDGDERIRAEAIKEFAERLKGWALAEYENPERVLPECVFVSVESINDLLEEMTGGKHHAE